jgi:HlyD family secretion protein
MPSESNNDSRSRASGGWRQVLSKRRIVTLVKIAVPLLFLVLLYRFFVGGDDSLQSATTYTARIAPMEVSVLEGGSIEALESQELKSEVRGTTKILSIVEEGYTLTQEDVANNKILVELDSKGLLDEQIQQELQYQNANASFAEAREQYEIQVNQNESDIKAAELAVKFARMDLEKYLGERVAKEIIDSLGLSIEAVLEETGYTAKGGGDQGEDNGVSANNILLPSTLSNGDDSPMEFSRPVYEQRPDIDFSKYADPSKLGDGQARQMLRSLEDDLVLAQEEVGLSQSKLEGTQRLFEKDFVTKNELENDEMAYKRKVINFESSGTSMELFIKYEFPKQAEKLLSDYEEALRKLERAGKLAVSKLAQAEAKRNSAAAQFELQTRKRQEIREQIEKCVIRATRPGLVVYGGGQDSWRREEQIEEGATVRERQIIITIPDTTTMSVKVKVHESMVKKVRPGQRVRVRVDSNPEILLEGKVQRIAVLPDSQNRWMNPDLKIYPTTIVIDGTHDWLKPGMSAQAEIIVNQIPNVLQIPLQAIHISGGEQVCYVQNALGVERRAVETGEFNESFIEIKSGLQEGEVVLLRPPRGFDDDAQEGGVEGEAGAVPEDTPIDTGIAA